MELDELKSHWKDISLSASDHLVHRSEIHEMITMQSQSLIASTGRRLRSKARTSAFVGLLTLVLGIITLSVKANEPSLLDSFVPHHTRYYMMIFMSMFILFIAWFNRKQYLRLRTLEQSPLTIRKALEDTIQRLHSVMKASILSDTIGAPIIVLWITYVQLYWGSPFLLDTRVFTLMGITMISIPVIYFIARQGQRGKYGAHLKELEQCLSELSSTAPENEKL